MNETTFIVIVGFVYVFLGIGIGIGGWQKFGFSAKLAYAMVFPIHTFFLALHDDERSSWVPHGLSLIALGLLLLYGINAWGFDSDFFLALGLLAIVGGILRMTKHGNDRGPLW